MCYLPRTVVSMFTADERDDCLDEAAEALARAYQVLAETTTAPAEARAV